MKRITNNAVSPMLSIIGELKLGAPTIRVMQLERTVRLSQPLYLLMALPTMALPRVPWLYLPWLYLPWLYLPWLYLPWLYLPWLYLLWLY